MQKDRPRTVYWLDNTLYINITNQCSNCCYFCLKRYKKGVSDFNLKLAKEPTAEQVDVEISEVLRMRNWDGVVFCGFGEPTSRLDTLLDVAKWIKENYKRRLEIRLDTNGHGYVLNPNRKVAEELKTAGIQKVSVSLNAGDSETYDEICKPIFPQAYEAVLEFVCKTKELLEVEVTAVRLPEVDLSSVQKIADRLGVKFKVRDYIPCFF